MQPGKAGSRRILIWQRRTLKKSSMRSANDWAARREGAVIRACSRRAVLVQLNLARHIAARVGIAEIHLQDCRRAQTHQAAVTYRKEVTGLLVVGERLLEPRGGQP